MGVEEVCKCGSSWRGEYSSLLEEMEQEEGLHCGRRTSGKYGVRWVGGNGVSYIVRLGLQV